MNQERGTGMNAKALMIAVAVAVAGIVMLGFYMQQFEERVSGGDPVPLLIASRDIPLGAVLTKGMLGERNMPEAYVEPRHIKASDVSKVIGVRVSTGVKANESVLWSDLATSNSNRQTLSALVQPGMRAMSFRVERSSTFGGLLRPGDRVDIYFTPENMGRVQKSQLLLQNILVMAMGGSMGAAGENTGFGSNHEITVSVTQEQGNKLAYAKAGGELTLTLRNPDDIAVDKASTPSSEATPESSGNAERKGEEIERVR